jgi:aminoglycoside phosphotransferase (APT) family kinase protein
MEREAFAGTGPVADRLRFDEDRLRRFLDDRIPGLGDLAVEQFRGGQSNPTYLLTTGAGRFVLRRKPPGQLLRTAHAIDREYRVIRALWPTPVPVAEPILLCEDPEVIGTAFYLMRFVAGRVYWDPTLPALSPGDRRAVYDAMNEALVALHSVDIEAVGLADFGKPGDYFQRQIGRWSSQYLASRTADLPAMDRLIEWLGAHPPAPSGRVALMHGDYRLDNMIFDPLTPAIRAIIDWELTTIGDPLADLSYQCTLWRLPAGMFGGLQGVDRSDQGLPTEGEYRDRYLERMGLGPVADWDRYLVYNLFRFAAILDGVGRRLLDGTAANPQAAAMAALAGPVAELGWRLAQETG